MKLISIVAISIFASCVFATPAQIVIIRHAEKPSTGSEVNQQGCERAYSLPNFFLTNGTVEQYGKPVAVYAVAPNDAYAAVRAIQTIAPTAQALGVQILDPATRVDYSTLVQQITSNSAYNGKTVLVAWEHKAIAGLAEAFGVTLAPDQVKWPNYVYDEAWVLNFTANSSAPSLQIIPENVLPGDNAQGGDNWQNQPGQFDESNVPQQIVNECANNDSLNQLVSQLVNPPLPQSLQP